MEYPIMYIDGDKKLNIYMAPEHDEDLLKQLNSLEIPYGDTDNDAVFRVTSGCDALIEKIVVHEAVKSPEGMRDQEIEIFYRFIGKID